MGDGFDDLTDWLIERPDDATRRPAGHLPGTTAYRELGHQWTPDCLVRMHIEQGVWRQPAWVVLLWAPRPRSEPVWSVVGKGRADSPALAAQAALALGEATMRAWLRRQRPVVWWPARSDETQSNR